MRRRELLAAAASAPLLGNWWSALAADAVGSAVPFDAGTVARMASALASREFRAMETELPAVLAGADYDAYRDLRYRPDKALWRDAPGSAFQAQFFHRGFLFKPRVDIHVVERGRAQALPFSTSLFDYAPNPAPRLDDIGFAGFRLHTPLNRPDYFDELCSFLGASYFRAVARGLGYGLSARGLAIGSGEPAAEEFPAFRAFWLHKPDAGSTAITIDALLDSPSVAGAFRFVVTPGDDTVFDVDARLFPRVELANAGIAPLTSMFHFDASGRDDVDDYRPAVHDSDGLAIWTASGEQVWRQLHNPHAIQHSGFQNDAPRGFGLMQRKREFADFQDVEAHYEDRPSAWIEPVGDWGDGEVHLVEIPTADEYHDNIVAFWRSSTPLAAGRESRWRYRVHWTATHRWAPALAFVVATRIGAVPKTETDARLIVIDLDDSGVPVDVEALEVEVTASAGKVDHVVVHARPDGGWRVGFEFEPEGEQVAEMRMRLTQGGQARSETWLYRWQA